MFGQDDIVRSALDLPEKERAEVARKIIESFDEAPNADVERAWADEVARRIHDLTSGRAGSVSVREAFENARSRIEP
jgi:putative addiction module component (TIGR02574 family)